MVSFARRMSAGGGHIFVGIILLPALAWACCAEPEAVSLSVGGWIDGYFLTPDGELGLHTLTLSSDTDPPTTPALHPLWAGYRIRLNFTPNQRVTAIRVTGTDSGEVLAEKSFDRPRNWPGLLLLCAEDDGFCHVRHGLSYCVEVTYADGRTGTAVAAVSEACLLPIPELKIDWIDLVRIAEVRRWLSEAGDNLLPGLRADDVPFALAGEDGQIVLVGWPAPPAGFHRYEGPAPIEDAIYLTSLPGDGIVEVEDAAGVAAEFLGTLSVMLPPDPDWWRAFASPGDQERRDRAATMLHEICHVNWRPRRPSGTGGPLAIPPLEARLLEETARRLLAEPNARVDGYPRVYQYLALMEERDRLLANVAAARGLWRDVETSEGYAYYVTWLARSVLDASVHSSPLADLRSPWVTRPPATIEDEVVRTLASHSSSADSALAWHPWAHAEYHGFREIAMLHRMDPGAVRRAWSRGTHVRGALATASGYAALSPDLKRRVLQAVKRGTGYRERLAAYQEEIAAGTETILARFAHPEGPGPTPVLVRGQAVLCPGASPPRATEPQLMVMFAFRLADQFGLEVERPALVSFLLADGGWAVEVRTLLEEVSALRDHPDGARLEVDQEEVRLDLPAARVTDEDGVLVVTMGRRGGD